MDNTFQILYVMGTGRSGSTILEILLSANDEVCSVGELTYIFKDGYAADETCACGAAFRDCDFWRSVQGRLSLSPCESHQYAGLFHNIDWHMGFFKLIFRCVSRENVSSYNRINEMLYEACASVTGKKVIVDSSKYPARALMLHRLFRSSVKIICLTRSPGGLLNAFQKAGVEQPAKSPFAVFAYYSFVLLCCRLVSLITKNVLFITFEELKTLPVETIRKIEKFTGISFEQTIQTLEENAAFTPGHIITGNRLRKQKSIYFRTKHAVHTQVPTKHKPFLVLMKTTKQLFGF